MKKPRLVIQTEEEGNRRFTIPLDRYRVLHTPPKPDWTRLGARIFLAIHVSFPGLRSLRCGLCAMPPGGGNETHLVTQATVCQASVLVVG